MSKRARTTLFVLGVIVVPVVAGLIARQMNDGGAQPDRPASSATSSPSARESDFAQKDLVGADFTDSNLSGANFEGAVLRRAAFFHADLRGANFEDADLANASFYGAQLQGARFGRANLEKAQFGGADLHDADLTDAVLDGTTFSGAQGVTDEMLARALGVPLSQLADAVHLHKVYVETEPVPNLQPACDGRPVSAALRYDPNADFHRMRVLDLVEFRQDTPTLAERAEARGWVALATRFTELVVCAKYLESVKAGSCGDYGGREVFNGRQRLRLSVVAARTGHTLRRRIFLGPPAGSDCPRYVSVGPYETGDKILGTVIDARQVVDWLSRFVGRPPGR